jgi:hypothetical protein
LVVALGVFAASITGPGEAAETLRIRGSARFDATATLDQERVVVTGVVVDDIGRPVAGGAITVDLLSADGQVVTGAVPMTCPTPRGAQNERSPVRLVRIETDRSGRFCALFSAGNVTSVALSFIDERGLFDQAQHRLAVDRRRRSVALRFVEPPSQIDVEREARITVATQSDAILSEPVTPLPIALYVRAQGVQGAPALVTERPCDLGESIVLTVPAGTLTTPGPIEVSARFAGNERLMPGEARIAAHATAKVTLALSRPPEPGDPTSGIELDVAVAAASGAVGSGAVEATLNGRTAGIARVERGNARVTVRFPRQGKSARVELTYLPNEPWWHRGPVLAVEVPIAPRGPWGTIVWFTLLSAVAVYLIRSWRRPRAEKRAGAPKTSREPRPSVVMVESDQSHALWRGAIRDAHDETPVARAQVDLVEPGRDRRVVARGVSDEHGEFELAGPSNATELLFVVRAPWHSELVSPAPGFGRVRIDLVTRRRQLLGRLARWAGKRLPLGRGRGEPTPGEVERFAKKADRPEVAEWAQAVEVAAFGPAPVDEGREREVIRREPPDPAGPAGGPT